MKLLKQLTLALTLGCSLIGAAAQAQEREIKFALDFIPLGRHAPWYVALSKGYFKAENLNVSILPTKGTADAIRYVESGLAEFGFIDIASLAASGGAGAPIRVVAANYQQAPYCVFSLNPGANVSAPKDLVGLEVGSSSASYTPKIYAAFMKMNGLDPSSLKIVNIDGAARVPMLAARKVPAIDSFLMSEPSIKRAVKDAQVKCLFLGDFGLDIYANGIGVREDFLKKNPEVVRGFVRAALRGWKDALNDPEEAARIQVQYIKALDPKIIVEELKLVRRLAVTADVNEHGLGAISREKMKRTVDFVNNNLDVQGKRTAEQIMVEGFLPSPPIKP
jgi:NitT/TauT family transport system substrate-binding protein